VNKIACEHDPRLVVDCTRVYHFGARFNVEMEIILPGDMTVAESHDIALALQHKIEFLEDVERAFVHVSSTRIDLLF
jgi:divalent metal cation (Fe/Co/Zn/Cd) transporter